MTENTPTPAELTDRVSGWIVSAASPPESDQPEQENAQLLADGIDVMEALNEDREAVTAERDALAAILAESREEGDSNDAPAARMRAILDKLPATALAEHDRQVRAEAWEEGWLDRARRDSRNLDDRAPAPPHPRLNPHRIEKGEDR